LRTLRPSITSCIARAIVFFLLLAPGAFAQVLTTADLRIEGASLEVVTPGPVTVQLGTAAIIQTRFGGKLNDEAPVVEGLSALGDLIGPGISTPVSIVTAPGHAFQVAGLSQEGVYYLQNIRLMKGDQLLQTAEPSLVVIQVTNALQTTVTVHQLTAEEMRARGISFDPSSYDVFEYTFSFLVDGKTVQIPYPVVINRLTHEVTPLAHESPYQLPANQQQAPPRWNPPPPIGFELTPSASFTPAPDDPQQNPANGRPSVHAAIVLPSSLAVLHQFFAVALVVTNGAPAGSNVTVDSVTASIAIPNQLRVVKSEPAVSFGQPVTIVDAKNGVSFLVAQQQGGAEWTVEGLKAGTYTLHLDVNATFKSPGQPDVQLHAAPSASVVVHDARFNITFSHPDTIRKGLPYSTYTFVTNTSDSSQDIVLKDDGIPFCSNGGFLKNVCRIDGTPSQFSLHLEPGQTKSVQNKLQSGLTGHIYATAASIDGSDSAINSASFILDLGVSPTGVPLSPVTLLLPYYARPPYFSDAFLDARLGELGIGYSLATAPLNKQTAKFPRVITTDVFTRAIDLARAGERMFIGEDHRDSLASLTLDVLGNMTPLAEWDQFRRQELEDPSGDMARASSASLGGELSSAYAGTDGTFAGMADRFAAATSARAPYAMVLVRGARSTALRPYAIRVAAGARLLDGPSSATGGWKRQLPYGDLVSLEASSESAELAVLGRVTDSLDVTITPAASASATLDLLFPSPDGRSLLHAVATLNGAAPVHVHLENGVATSSDIGLAVASVPLTKLAIVAARQDLHLDPDGHVVSVLFNRALPPTSADLSPALSTDVTLDVAKFGVGYTGTRRVAGAALQQDGRIIRVNYDAALSDDVSYLIHTNGFVDPSNSSTVTPVIEHRSSALLYGTVLSGTNTPLPGTDLTISTGTGLQWQKSDSNGRFLFEYIPRDPDNQIGGNYTISAVSPDGKRSILDGSVRLLHTVHQVNVTFLGRGSARGHVRYDNGDPVANAAVVVGSTMFSQFRRTTTDSTGYFNVDDVPVGPLTFSAQDTAGNVAYAANELRAGGAVVTQDISIFRRPFPGTGTVRGRIIRNDTQAPVAGAHVGVYSQGYGLRDATTGADGLFEFTKVPSGFVTVLAADYDVAPQSLAVDFDLKADAVYSTGDLALNVRAGEVLVAVDGDVTIENPLQAGDFHAVAGAQVQIDGMPVITADSTGHFAYPSVPLSFTGARIRGYDTSTRRVGTSSLPTLSAAGVNHVPIIITNASGSGSGTVRVHLLSASGAAVLGYHVFEPGYPNLDAAEKSDGVYEFATISVGRTLTIVAAPKGSSDATYGYQFAQAPAQVTFAGQIAAVSMRLPGQGTLRGRIAQQTESGTQVSLAGKLHLFFNIWGDVDRQVIGRTVETTTDGVSDAVFSRVPAGQGATLETFESVGYASTAVRMNYDGDSQSRTLLLSTLASVRGRVLAPDGYTPVAGAAVRLVDGSQDFGLQPTALDGSFEFRNVVPNSGWTATAEWTQNGIFRTARASGSTPASGGPVNNVDLILMSQGSVDGKVVDFNGNAVPFAKFWLRELDFPSRELGRATDPLIADGTGHFRLNNIFAVSFRLTAVDPNNPDARADYNGVIQKEGDVVTPVLTVGTAGSGTVRITVYDSNGFNVVPNVEVSLLRGGLFDLATTDASGSVTFESVPVGNYTASAYSKFLAKFGSIGTFAVARSLTSNQQINLVFSGEVDGSLTDPENASTGVPGANVTLTGSGYQTRATTDTAGLFDFKGVREGSVQLEARDPLSVRRAVRTAVVSTAAPTAHVALTLEPTSVLTVKAFLPNDSGQSSGILAPLVSIDVTQNSAGGAYLRSSQTNGATFPGMVRGAGFRAAIHELGGLNRMAFVDATFAPTESTKEVRVVFSATGSVVVNVLKSSPPVPAPNVLVDASSGGVSVSGYTDANGTVTLSNLPLGTVSMQASTLGILPLTAAGSVVLQSQSVAPQLTLQIGSYSGIEGLVNAEEGGPSSGTRVIAVYNGITLETRTDATGKYLFQGIATTTGGVTVNLIYLGPDDQTIGATQSLTVPNGAGTVTASTVTLDSTPPRILSIFPADGALKVAPDSQLKITFSRSMNTSQLSSGYVHLYDAGLNVEVMLSLLTVTIQGDGKTMVATFVPPVPTGGQRFPLRSNALYRLQVSGSIQDNAGHRLGVDVGGSFTTSDYSNPQVTAVTPSPALPLPRQGLRFAVTFSKPLAAAPWQPGGSGSMTLVQLDRIGGNPTGGSLAGTVQLDPSTSASLYFGPDVTLPPASFFRLTIAGAVDSEGRGLVDASGNAISAFTKDFFSYDDISPVVTIGNPLVKAVPIGPSDPLYSTILYTLPVTVANSDGSPVTDLSRVDFFSVAADGSATSINHAAPLSVDLSLPQGTSSFTLKAIAYDLSGNSSPPVTRTWAVQPVPPLQIASTSIQPSTLYAGRPLIDTVHVVGGALDATVSAGAYVDGASTPVVSASTTITRTSLSASWPDALLQLTLPPTIPSTARVVLTAVVSDVRGAAPQHDDVIVLAPDSLAPAVRPLTIEVLGSSTPGITNIFHNTDQYRVHVLASDAETGLKSVVFAVDGTPYTVSTGTYHPDTQQWEFVSPTITVVAHNNDLTVPVTAEASDYAGNRASVASSLTYLGIHDQNAPTVAWISPLHDAAWPASQTAFATRLSVLATSPLPLNVRFELLGRTFPGVRNGAQFDADITIDTTSDASIPVVAHVDDGDGGHIIDLPITIDLVPVGRILRSGQTLGVDATHPLDADSVLVDGGRLVLHVPISVKNVLVINGGLVDTVASTAVSDERIDMSISDHLFVDARSSVDVSGRGYLGGFQSNPEGTGNTDGRGMTLARALGASNGASGSYAGLGGDASGATNSPYGSIVAPADLGSGGAADSPGRRGGQGGGAAVINALSGAGKVVVAGTIAADGEAGTGIGGAGSGGSIAANAKTIVLGAGSSVRSNGGDDDGSNQATRGGGGGRVALQASVLLDVDATTGARVVARGGRNLFADNTVVLDGGAGTIFLRSAGETNGDLLVSASDSVPAATSHLTRATVLSGTLVFDRLTAGPRSLLRIDSPVIVNGVSNAVSAMERDPSAVVLLPGDVPAVTATTTPAAGATLLQNGSLGVAYSATSTAGIARIIITMDPALTARTDSFPYGPTAIATSSITVPSTAAAGTTATVRVRAEDRAGRFADVAPVAFTIAADAAPVLDFFDVSAPSPFYVGHTISTSIAAHDDVAVTRVSLTRQVGTGAATTQSATPGTAIASQQFQIPIVADPALDGQTVTLTAAVEDGFPGRAATSVVKTLTIAHDGTPPVLAVSQPSAGAQFDEGNGKTIHVVVTASDAETSIKAITASIEGVVTPVSLVATANAGEYAGDVPVPSVPDGNVVPRKITVTATDLLNNAQTAFVTVNVKPLFDPTAPVVTWLCGTEGSLYPVGYVATLSVTAVPGASGTNVDTVTFSDGATTLAATKSGSTYSASYTVPALPAGTPVTIIATVTSLGGGVSSTQATISVVAIDKTISADRTIGDGDLTYDLQNVAITAGTTTISGHHEFKTLLVLSGAKVTHLSAATLATAGVDLKADTLFVSCGGAIDGSGLGYGPGGSYPDIVVPSSAAGGSHLGLGGTNAASSAYGSVYQPQEYGAGGGTGYCCASSAAGGGRVSIDAGMLQLDGSILANGLPAGVGGGAGGSVWVKATRITGAGIIQVSGGASGQYFTGSGGAGGGAIAIQYSDAASSGPWLSKLNAQGSSMNGGPGGAGTIWIRSPSAIYGSLKIDGKGIAGGITDLPSLGTGLAGSGSIGAILITDRATNIPEYFSGHWVEIRDFAGTLKGRWKIAQIDAANRKKVTLAPNASEPIDIVPGDSWRGIYRFDDVSLAGAEVLTSKDPILIGSGSSAIHTVFGGTTSYATYADPIVGDEVLIKGLVSAPEVRARNLTVETGAILSNQAGPLLVNVTGTLTVRGRINATSVQATDFIQDAGGALAGLPAGPLTLTVSGSGTAAGSIEAGSIQGGSFTVAAGGVLTHAARGSLAMTLTNLAVSNGATVDVSGLGYDIGSSYPGAVVSNDGSAGGSHMGRGGKLDRADWFSGSTFGSIYQPRELGGGGAIWGPYRSSSGGGRVSMQVTQLQLDGLIRANGLSQEGPGAGGSVWIRAGKITGGGGIQANGGAVVTSGGGGAIAIEYGDPLSNGAWLTNLSASAASFGAGVVQNGAAGTILVKGPSSTYGTLTIDNKGTTPGQETQLPSLGNGFALAGTIGATLVTDRAANIDDYFAGNWLEVRDGAGVLKGRWKIASVDSTNRKKVTLTPNGTETITLVAGDQWRGIYRFDAVNIAGTERLISGDQIVLGNDGAAVTTIVGGTTTYATYSQPIFGDDVLIRGLVQVPEIRATALTVAPGAVLAHAPGGGLVLKVTGKLTVASGGAIDVSGFGYDSGFSYPGAIPSSGGSAGGSHLGKGGRIVRGDWYSGSTFGSVYQPQESGGGGAQWSSYRGPTGGGRVTVQAGQLQLDGAIRANGASQDGPGAAGSIWIRAAKISGDGVVQANGGAVVTSGGGGAIAVEYSDPASTGAWSANIRATAANLGAGLELTGAPGTIWIKGPGATYGALTIDSKGTTPGQETQLPSLGIGLALAGSGGATILTDRTVDIPSYFAGHWVEVTDSSGSLRGSWRIASVSARSFTLAPNGNETISLLPGDTYAGVYRFDDVHLRGVTLSGADPLRVSNPIDNLGSTVLINDGAPRFPPSLRSQIIVSSSLDGDYVSGPSGAVVDNDQPLHLVVTNVRTARTFGADAATDGSFRIPVSGLVGDTFTLRATDSHQSPLTSVAIPVNGTIASANSVVSVTVQPESLAAGAVATGGVRLLYPAHGGNGLVALSSSHSSVTVPATVMVPDGAQAAAFDIIAAAGASQSVVTITARGGTGLPQSASLTLIANTNAIAGLTLADTAVDGGVGTNGTVNLSGPAPAGGASVMLTSSNTSAAILPALILVPEASSNASFSISTLRRSAAAAVTISATYGAVAQANLTVRACSAMGAVATPAATISSPWIDDAPPAGSIVGGSPASFTSTYSASGSQSLMFPAAAGLRTWSFSGATATITPASNDLLVLYALVNPCNPPREILAAWSDGSSEYRASWGESLIEVTTPHTRVDTMPAGGSWVRLTVRAAEIGAAGHTLRGLALKVYDGEVWFDAIGPAVCSLGLASRPTVFPGEQVWFDDTLPSGAVVPAVGGGTSAWTWDSTQVVSGSASHLEPPRAGFHEHYFLDATQTMPVAVGDVIFTYVLLDPCNPPSELLLQLTTADKGKAHRVYWGENLINVGIEGTAERFRMGPLPKPGEWVRLDIPASFYELEGTEVTGADFALVNGGAWFDRLGKIARVNLAAGKTAQQSSTFSDVTGTYGPAGAVDGITAGDYPNAKPAMTLSQPFPWWQVDLGSVQPIEQIQLWNRTDAFSNRLRNFVVFVSDNPFASTDPTVLSAQAGISRYSYPGTAAASISLLVNRTGRYVRVQLLPTDVLQLAEVQVWAPVGATRVNLASGGKAAISAAYDSWTSPENGVNGDLNAPYGTGASIFHTTNSSNFSWWQVDLGKSSPLSSIDLHNCVEGSNQWMTDFYVLVSDAPFAADDSSILTQAGVSVYYFDTVIRPSMRIPLDRSGRYIRLQKRLPNTYLAGSEVRVWGQQTVLAPLSVSGANQ
jgi:hypothetical protein